MAETTDREKFVQFTTSRIDYAYWKYWWRDTSRVAIGASLHQSLSLNPGPLIPFCGFKSASRTDWWNLQCTFL